MAAVVKKDKARKESEFERGYTYKTVVRKSKSEKTTSREDLKVLVKATKDADGEGEGRRRGNI